MKSELIVLRMSIVACTLHPLVRIQEAKQTLTQGNPIETLAEVIRCGKAYLSVLLHKGCGND
jgi:hypothetical protein